MIVSFAGHLAARFFPMMIDALNQTDFRASLKDEKQMEIFDYWFERKSPEGWMERQQLDPSDIPALLPNIFMIDSDVTQTIFTYRLVGTLVSRSVQGNMVGKTVEAVRAGALVGHLNALFTNCLSKVSPCLGVSELQGESSQTYRYDRLVLPMSSDGKRADIVLGLWTSNFVGLPKQKRYDQPVMNSSEYPTSLITVSSEDRPTKDPLLAD